MQPGIPQGPNNIRSRAVGDKFELRKHWNIRDAEYVYELVTNYLEQTAELVEGDDGAMVPDWDKITEREVMGPAVAQGNIGNQEWAEKTASHYGIAIPEDEFKAQIIEE